MDMTNVRTMAESDLPEVKALADELGYSCSIEELKERFFYLGTLSHHALRVWKADKVLGFMHLEEVSDLIEEKKIEIKALVVSETARSKGIGSNLIQEAQNWAKVRGSSMLYLSCSLKREKAHAFYNREGFSLIKTSHFFEKQV